MGKEGAVGIILSESCLFIVMPFRRFFLGCGSSSLGYGAGAHADDGWRRCAEAMRHSWGRAWPQAVFDRFGHEKVLFSEFSQKCLMFFAYVAGFLLPLPDLYHRRRSRGKIKEKWL